ncbi:MAG: heparinase II/III domain-containing protein [Armatimonadota bacterium]
MRALFAAFMICAPQLCLAQHPTVLMIEDFEDEPTWESVTLDGEMAKEGKRSGLWIPARQGGSVGSDDIPHDWTPYDRLCLWMYSETANNQRLTLVANSDNAADEEGWDYFFHHFTVDWSGWKHLSLGLGSEIRPTRKPRGWDQIDSLRISASGWQHHPLKDTVIRLDEVRLVRDPAAIEQISKTPETADGRYTLTYRFRLTNRGDRPRSFPLRLEGGFEVFEAALSAEETGEIDPGGSAEVQVQLSADREALAAAEPLMREAAQLVVEAVDEEAPVIAAEVAASVPLPEMPRPLLFASQAEIDRALERAGKYEWAREQVDGIIETGEQELEREVDVPDEPGQWGHHYVCKDCGVGLRTESPTRHVCPRCGKVYSGWPYDQVYISRIHHGLTGAVHRLGLAYALTGDRRFAEKAREILLAYGRKYREFPLHNVRGHESRSAGRLYAQTLDEAVDIIRVCWGYDLIYDSGVFSDEDREVIEEGYLRAVAETVRRNDAGKSNWQTWHNAGLAAIGFCLRDPELASLAINGPHGMHYQLDASVLPDGFWYEGTAAYHFYALNALRWTAEAALHSGIDFYDDPRYESLFEGPLLYVFPDLTFPAVNDSDVMSLLGRDELYELAYARFGDEKYAAVAQAGNRSSLEALLWGADELPPAPPLELPSKDFAGLGAAVLRAGAGSDQAYLHLDYGPHGGGHGHPDKLTLILFALGRELAPDPGRLAYGAPLHGQWYRQTVAHNTLVVDERSQQAAEGRLTLFHDGEVAKIARATCDTAYPGVEMRRTVVLTEGLLLDVLEAQSDEEHLYDWAWHNVGEMLPGPEAAPVDGPIAEGAGYQHISDVRRADGSATWHADFVVPQAGSVRLMMLGEPGTELLFGTGLLGRSVQPCPMVLARRTGRRAVWMSAVEWRGPHEELSLTGMQRLPVTIDGREAGADEALALEVQRRGGAEMLLLAPDAGDRKQFGGVTTEADICYVALRDGDVVAMEHIDL